VKSTSEIAHLNTLAFLYDHQKEFPVWLRRLTHTQLVDIAKLMIAWHSTSGGKGIVPIEEVEQREVLRAITLCGGDVTKAATALKIGKSTIYTKLRRWGYSIENRVLIHQASALAQGARGVRDRFFSSL
jgi:transcriptional regulator of acetoin/glycerol metabolism